jgi:hypothetical protein
MSSLPDAPLGPITGKLALVKESLLAILLATRDPLANYKEGIASRARAQAPAPLASGIGWSPWGFFRGLANLTPAGRVVSALDPGKRKRAPAAPAPAPAPEVKKPESPAPEPEAKSEGDEDDILAPTFKRPKRGAAQPPLPAEALARARAAAEDGVLPPDPGTGKRSRLVSSIGAERTFRDHVVAALKTKKMTRADFNRAVALQAGAGASDAKKKAIGASVLSFLAKKSVKIAES